MTTSFIIPYRHVVDAEKFSEKLEALQHSLPFSLKTHEIGADREQWLIEWCDHLLVVYVEHLSESAWIESMSTVSEEKLQIFYKQLICD